ncbi:MAG: Uncharacterised protein [Flavobacteriia bacterium]|nr:MAG: Uncharacterised protein [Flavobacteriia bacterium]
MELTDKIKASMLIGSVVMLIATITLLAIFVLG